MATTEREVDSNETAESAFHAVVDAETIQRTVALVRTVVDECRVRLDGDGIRIAAMDPATVAAVDLELPAEAFESYDAAGGRLGVDLTRLGEVVGMAERGQLVEVRLDAETRPLDVAVGDLEYTLGLVDPESVRSPPDTDAMTFDHSGEVVLVGDEVNRAVQAADMVSDHVAFGIDEGEEQFYATADGDTDDVSLTQDAADCVAFTPGDAHSLFSVDYLRDINGELPGDAEVTLQLGTEQPLEARYEFASGDGSVRYQVAPRIASR